MRFWVGIIFVAVFSQLRVIARPLPRPMFQDWDEYRDLIESDSHTSSWVQELRDTESETSPADDQEEHGRGKSFWSETVNRLLKSIAREQSGKGKIKTDYRHGEDSNEEWQYEGDDDDYNNGIDNENSGKEENYSGMDRENEEIFEGEEEEEGDNDTENKNEDNFEGEPEEEDDNDIESENEDNFEGEEEEVVDNDIESENEDNFEGEEEEEVDNDIESENEDNHEGEEEEKVDNTIESENEDNHEGEEEEKVDNDIESENEDNHEGEEEEKVDNDIESENEDNHEGEEEEEEEEEVDNDIESENEDNHEGEEEEKVDNDIESEYNTDEGREEEEEEERDYNINDNEEINNFEGEEEYEDEKDERTKTDKVGEEYSRVEDDGSESPEEVDEDWSGAQGNDPNGIPRNVIRSAVEDVWDGHPFYSPHQTFTDFSLVDNSVNPKRLMHRHAQYNGMPDVKHTQNIDGIHNGRQGSELETNDVQRRSVDGDDELFSHKTSLHDHYPERYIKYAIDTQIDNENNQAWHLEDLFEGIDKGFWIKEAKEFNMARDVNSPNREDSMKNRGTESEDRGDDYRNTKAQSLENEFDASSQSEEFGMANDFPPHDKESFEENGEIQSNEDDQGEVNDEEDINRVAAWEPNDERLNEAGHPEDSMVYGSYRGEVRGTP